MKNKIICVLSAALLLTISLLSINVSGELKNSNIPPVPDISGNWFINYYDWQGNLTDKEYVYCTVYDLNVSFSYGNAIITEGIIEENTETCPDYIIYCSDFSGLGVSKIFIYNDSLMITEMPLCESCNPAEFVRGDIQVGVNVTCEGNQITTYPNNSMIPNFVININNTGDFIDTFILSLPDLIDCCYYASLSQIRVTLQPNESTDVILSVDPYENNNATYEITVVATSLNNGSIKDSVITYTTVIEDKKSPTIEISRPEKGLYFFNTKIRKYFFRKPLIIGPISLWFNAIDEESGISNFKIYIDDVLQFESSGIPKSWNWEKGNLTGLRYTIKAVVQDSAGNSCFDEMEVIRIL